MRETGHGHDVGIRERVLEALHNCGERISTYSGEKFGTSLLVVGGTHGNEILGILVVDMLRDYFDRGVLQLVSGELRLTLGNTRAIEAGERTAPGGADFNRIFRPSVLQGEEELGWEGRRARSVAEAIRTSDIVIDLHSTNRPSRAFVCALGDEEHQAVYKWLPRESVVLDPERIVSGGGGSIDEIADDFGKIGICYESGQATDASNLGNVFQALCAVMIEQGMIEGELPELPPRSNEYTVVTTIPYDPLRAFVFAEGKEQGFAELKKGEVLGYYDTEPVYAPVDGVVLFPKKPEHQEQAGLVCYVAVKKEESL